MTAQPSSVDEMTAFDRLPKSLRHALANAGEQFSATQVRLLLRKGRRVSEVRDMIASQDRVRPVRRWR